MAEWARSWLQDVEVWGGNIASGLPSTVVPGGPTAALKD